jgi:hypothetical protein
MMVNLLLPLLFLTAPYAALVAGLAFLLHRVCLPGRLAVLVSALLFGLVTGVLAVWLWPLDSAVLFNWPGVLLGDQIYSLSIQILGESHSSQAHYAIPWPLRIPQVTLLASLLAWGILGLIAQWFVNRRADRETRERAHESSSVVEST